MRHSPLDKQIVVSFLPLLLTKQITDALCTCKEWDGMVTDVIKYANCAFIQFNNLIA